LKNSAQKMVRTVLGEIKPEQMGNTSVHEHLCGLIPTPPECISEERAYVIEELKKAKEAGLDTIIEVTPFADPYQLQYIAERSPVNIIACTGFYLHWTEEQKQYSIEQFLEHIVMEAEKGIGGSGILPGVIKIASQRSTLQPHEVRVLTAAGMAQKITGLPLCVHSVTGTRYQQYLIEAGGADMEKVYFSHLESPSDRENRTLPQHINYIENTMKRGSYVSYNGFDFPTYLNPAELAEFIKQPIEHGFVNRLLLSMDFYWTYRDGKRRFWFDETDPNVVNRTYPHLMTHVLPWLKEIGVNDDDIDCMLRRNVYALFK
jgi:phosphotriesterase-related protein